MNAAEFESYIIPGVVVIFVARREEAHDIERNLLDSVPNLDTNSICLLLLQLSGASFCEPTPHKNH